MHIVGFLFSSRQRECAETVLILVCLYFEGLTVVIFNACFYFERWNFAG